MNDPAPPFGRNGWVCAALLLGLFAGGGITWAVLGRRLATAPLIVYPLPPSGEARSGPSPQAGPSLAPPGGGGSAVVEASAEARLPGPTGREGEAAGADGAGNEAGAPGTGWRRLDPAVRDGVMADSATVAWEGPGGRSPQPALRFDSDHLLRSHPKAEGCLANALAALAAFTQKGFIPRETVWIGEVSLEEGKAVSCQLFKGNNYCFCVGTDAKGTKLSLQLYDGDGTPADAEQLAQESAAGANASACLQCRQTGTYFVVVKLEAATQEKVPWGMVYAYR